MTDLEALGVGDAPPPYMIFLVVFFFFLTGLLGFLICHLLKKKGYRCRTGDMDDEDEEEEEKIAVNTDGELRKRLKAAPPTPHLLSHFCPACVICAIGLSFKHFDTIAVTFVVFSYHGYCCFFVHTLCPLCSTEIQRLDLLTLELKYYLLSIVN